jgi:hypothetical protein
MICRNTAIHLIPHSVRKRDAKQAPCHHHHWGRSKHIVAKGNVLLSGVAGVEYCLNTPLNVIFMVLQMWHEERFNDNQPNLKLLGSILVIIMKEDVLLQEVDGRYVSVGSRNAIALGHNIIWLVKACSRKIAILNMFQALYNHSFCEMQIMMMMHNTHTSWDGKPMATMG